MTFPPFYISPTPGAPRCTARQARITALTIRWDRKTLLEICRPALAGGQKVSADIMIHNTDRTAGTILGNAISTKYGSAGLPEDTINLHFYGSAGQSLGAFVPRGVTMTLDGDANDYCGKGLSGGKLIVKPPKESPFEPEDNIIIGNVSFYGATGGEAYIYGAAGERFCVRNSGVHAVVEAVGDHGCEYMTGGRVVVLGGTGRNFAAGMSGGVAFVYDADGSFPVRCNAEMVALEKPEGDELATLKEMIQKHYQYTGSKKAKTILDSWETESTRFVQVMPKDYKRMMQAIKTAHDEGYTGDEALMAAFEANNKDQSRVSGN